MNINHECPVCLEEILTENYIMKSCGHSFCKNCTSKLTSCALCRNKWDTFEKYELCNKDYFTTKSYIKVNNYYLFLLPKKKIVLTVYCTYKTDLVADMKIISATKNEEPFTKCIGNYFGYRFKYYNIIFFESFSYKEDVLIYILP